MIATYLEFPYFEKKSKSDEKVENLLPLCLYFDVHFWQEHFASFSCTWSYNFLQKLWQNLGPKEGEEDNPEYEYYYVTYIYDDDGNKQRLGALIENLASTTPSYPKTTTSAPSRQAIRLKIDPNDMRKKIRKRIRRIKS